MTFCDQLSSTVRVLVALNYLKQIKNKNRQDAKNNLVPEISCILERQNLLTLVNKALFRKKSK